MLLNIIKLRYFDTPVFLDVASVISSYTLESQVSLSANIFPNAPANLNQGIGASGTYTEHPTVSYAPLTGERFVNSLLRPILPQAVFAMVQAGHPADYILRATVQAINGVYNSAASPPRARREDPAFGRVIEALRRIQQAGALDVRVETREGKETTLISFRENVDPEVDNDISSVRKTLGIDPAFKELVLTYGSARRAGGEIALFTRSMLQILVELSTGVEVPEEDMREGRAVAIPASDSNLRTRGPSLVRIRSGTEQLADAYAAVHYRSHWFWIDDRDLVSKRVFTFLMMFTSIAETGAVPQVPIITIPAN